MTKQVINIGTTANDGTGDTLRDAMSKANDNFTELYAISGPFNGSKAANFELKKAIKTFSLNGLYNGHLVYISKIVAGTLDGGNYTYTIEIHETTTFAVAGTKICAWTAVVGAEKTGLELIFVGQNAQSGKYCYVGIDWGELTTGTTYTSSNYPDGAIFCPVVTGTAFTGGGETDDQVEVITENETVVDGSKKLYVCDALAEITVAAAAFADIVGEINIINIGGDNVIFAPNSTETFNGYGVELTLAQNESARVIPYDGNFIMTGNATVVPAP